MTLREIGASYFKTLRGKILIAATFLAALIFVCLFADTLAHNTYVPKAGKSVIDTIKAQIDTSEQLANKLQMSNSYASLSANQKEWHSEEAGLEKGIFCVTTKSDNYIVYNIDSENIADSSKNFNDFDHIWIDSASEQFYAVLNISGKIIDLSDYYILVRDESGIYGSRAILNFYEAEKINISNAIVMGTILAPNAEIICDNATIYGQIQVKASSGKISYNKDIRFTGYKEIMSNLNVVSLINDEVRIAAIEYLINHDPDNKYSDYTISSSIRVRDINAVKKLSIFAPEAVYVSLESDLAIFPNLEEILISGGDLPSFSLKTLPNIKSLEIEDTNIKELDINAAKDLVRLVLNNNASLYSLDFTQNSKIEILSYSGTPLGWMDYSCLPELYYLDCSYSNVKPYVTISGENIPKLKMLKIAGNREIQTFWIQTFPLLTAVDCSKCGIIRLDFSESDKLIYFKGSDNRFTNIDFREAVNLKYIEVHGWTVETIDIRGLKPYLVYTSAYVIKDIDLNDEQK